MISKYHALDLLGTADLLSDGEAAKSLRLWVQDHYDDGVIAVTAVLLGRHIDRPNVKIIKRDGDFALRIDTDGCYSVTHIPSGLRLRRKPRNINEAINWLFRLVKIDASAADLDADTVKAIEEAIIP
jgi:hypothetical protein